MLTFLAGLLPAAILVLHIYRADRLQPEPWPQLRRAIIFGIGSIFVSFLFSGPFRSIGLYSEEYTTMSGALHLAFWGAGLPEELAKLIMLYLVVRKCPYFDEYMDGIVYAVCVGMGFAGFENIQYLLMAGDNWFNVSFTRALMAVPCHYYNAVIMGYFFAKFWFGKQDRLRNLCLCLVVPVLMHTAYDFTLMYLSVIDNPAVAGVLYIFLFWLCFKFYKVSRNKIAEHLDKDARDMNGYQKSENSNFYDRNDSI